MDSPGYCDCKDSFVVAHEAHAIRWARARSERESREGHLRQATAGADVEGASVHDGRRDVS